MILPQIQLMLRMSLAQIMAERGKWNLSVESSLLLSQDSIQDKYIKVGKADRLRRWLWIISDILSFFSQVGSDKHHLVIELEIGRTHFIGLGLIKWMPAQHLWGWGSWLTLSGWESMHTITAKPPEWILFLESIYSRKISHMQLKGLQHCSVQTGQFVVGKQH